MMLAGSERKHLRSDFARKALRVTVNIGDCLKAKEIDFEQLQTNHTCSATKIRE